MSANKRLREFNKHGDEQGAWQCKKHVFYVNAVLLPQGFI